MSSKRRILLSTAISLFSVATFLYNPSLGVYLICFSLSHIAFTIINKRRFAHWLIYLGVFTGSLFLLIGYAEYAQAEIVRAEIGNYLRKHGKTPETIEELFELPTMSMTPSFIRFKYSSDYDSALLDFYRIEYDDVWGNNIRYCPKCGEWETRN